MQRKMLVLLLGALALMSLGAWSLQAAARPVDPIAGLGNVSTGMHRLMNGALAQPIVRSAVHSDQSAPLYKIPPRITKVQDDTDNENPPLRSRTARTVADSVLQKALGPLVMPAPIANFDGEYNEYGPIPPNTDGDVGRNHYVQIVNSGFTVYDKSGSGIP